jgi:hypothetical protein
MESVGFISLFCQRLVVMSIVVESETDEVTHPDDLDEWSMTDRSTTVLVACCSRHLLVFFEVNQYCRNATTVV